MAFGAQQQASSGETIPPQASERQASRTAQQVVAQLAELRPVHEAFAWFRAHARELEDIQLEVTAIAAPPWGEAARAEWLRERFAGLGLTEVHLDELGNVFGIHPGADTKAPFLALSAHIDTVFPAGTPITVSRQENKLCGPGISDNGSGVTALLAMASVLTAMNIAHSAPILFIGNVGEEGEGNLRGMRHIFEQPRWLDSIGALVVLDGAGTDTIIAEGLGSRRYEITVRGPGGHSWSDFGVANPIVALARIIERFSQTTVPATPKTTFNVGVVEGGTSVNSIPQSATMRVDTRSASVEQLDRLEKALRDAVKEGAAHAAGRKKQEALTAEVRVIGDRPAADLPSDSRLMKMIRAVDGQLQNSARVQRASTDANIPLALGREAIAIGAGGSGGGAHTVNEWYDSAGRDLGLKRILLLTLAMCGVAEE
ncbi:MAG: M20/M25/M40 family metallo-hydrolase [Candidatus Korobacteraceae bacterium]